MLHAGGVSTTCTTWRRTVTAWAPRPWESRAQVPRPWGSRAQPPTSGSMGTRCFGYTDHSTSRSQKKISMEQHPASPFALQPFTEEDGCFNASISLGVLWPAVGRKGAFAAFAAFGPRRRLQAAEAGPGRCCPLGAAGSAEHGCTNRDAPPASAAASSGAF